jgi:copper(I)-binding protein
VSSSLRRGALAAAAIAFSIASLAACAAGSDAQTLEVKPDNAATKVGNLKVQNVIIITQPNLQSTGPAAVAATVFNNGDSAQTLDSITLPGTGKTAELKPAKGSGPLTVPAHGSVVIGGKGNASASLASSREAVKDGDAQKITFTFSETGEVSLRAFVVPSDNYFKKWGPSEIPTGAPSTSPKPSKTATGSSTPTGSASTSTSTSATPTDAASASVTASNSAAGQ